MSVAETASSRPQVRIGPDSWQWALFVVEPLALLGAALWSQSTQPDSFRLFWTEPLGQKMLIQAGMFLAGNVVLLAGGCILIDRCLGNEGALRHTLTALLHVGCGIFLFLPVIWVVMLGPAALHIARTLAM